MDALLSDDSPRVTPEDTIPSMCPRSALLESLGGEEGCWSLSEAFYARVGKDPVLRPFFPCKSLRCATEELAAFLIQFLDGAETQPLAPRFASRASVFVGLLARIVQTGRARLIHFVIEAAEGDPSLATGRFAGTSLLHFAAGAGCLEIVALLLRLGVDPNIQGRGRTPLYCVANQCASETGPEVVRALVRAGADVHAGGGVKRAAGRHIA